MNKLTRDVAEFHIATGSHISAYPKLLEVKSLKKLRINLVEEEAKEVVTAIEGGSLSQVAKELCDLIYVTVGTALAYGINLQPVWDEVHASNMTKTDGSKRADGKVLKPANYKETDIEPLIDDQIRTGILRARKAALPDGE